MSKEDRLIDDIVRTYYIIYDRLHRNIHVTATRYYHNDGDHTACTDCVGMRVEVGEYLLADKSSFVTVNPERYDNRSAILSLRPTTVNSAFRFFFFCSTALPHTHTTATFHDGPS